MKLITSAIIANILLWPLYSYSSNQPAPPNIDTQASLIAPIKLWKSGDFETLLANYSAYDLSDHAIRLDVYCSANLITGRYSDFFKCMDVWKTSSFSLTLGIESSANEPYLVEGLEGISNTMPIGDVEARRLRLLAEAWFQLGDYEQALNFADKALQAYHIDSDYWIVESFSTYHAAHNRIHADHDFMIPADAIALPGRSISSHWSSDILLVATIAAQSTMKLGEKHSTHTYLNIIANSHKDEDNDEIRSGMSRLRTMYLNGIYLAANDFDKMKLSGKTSSEYLDDIKGGSKIAAGYFLVALSIYGGSAVSGTEAFTESGSRDLIKIFAEEQELRENFQNAIVLMHKKEWNSAQEYLLKILDSKIIDSHQEMKHLALQQQGIVHMQKRNLNSALLSFSKAMDIIEKSRGNTSTEAQKLGFFGDKDLPYRQSMKILLEQGNQEEALVISERFRARALVDLLADSQARRHMLPDAISTENVALAANTTVSTQQSSSQLRYRALKRKNNSATIKKIEAQSLRSVQVFDATELKKLVPAGEAVIEYVKVGTTWHAFIVTPQSITSVALNIDDLENRIEKFRTLLQQPANNNFRKEAMALHESLIKPLNIDENLAITIIPSGVLNYLPFSALMDNNQFLVEKFTLKLMPSVTSMAFLQETNRSIRLLALGNPTGDLPGAEKEVHAIAKNKNNALVAIKNQASETLLKDNGSKFSIIHIASHGEFNGEDPSASRLLLHPDEANDGNLTMLDIYSLKLSANLVVLSACETGLNKISNGEEIFGLTRGFLYAGSSNVIASLWKVDDDATQQLMRAMYRKIDKGDYAKALQSAQNSLLNGNYSHPFYWASFQLTGKG